MPYIRKARSICINILPQYSVCSLLKIEFEIWENLNSGAENCTTIVNYFLYCCSHLLQVAMGDILS